MPDQEKVIKAIECCVVNHTRCFDDNSKLCPYFTTKVYMCETELLKDALALLKQEAVEPKHVDLYGKDEWWGLVCVCPDCKAEWMSDKADTHFCPRCGRPVKWE